MTFTSTHGSRRAGGNQVIRVAPLDDAEIVAMGRVLVTSAVRTVIDCARSMLGPDALAIADRRSALVS
jgi:hypothetical protein